MTDSVATLFDTYGDTVYRRCLQMLRNPAAARDAVQEVFLRVLTKRESFQGRSSMLTWIYAIATTHCLQQLRNQKRRGDKLDSLLAEAPPASALIDERISLQRVLDETDPVTQEIVYLRYMDGMTLEEVAEVVLLSRKTVQTKLEHFRVTAQGTLGAEGGSR